MATRKSEATLFLEGLVGEPLNIGRYLRSIRKGESVSQVEFASLLGISKSHLCDIERGRKAVSAARAAEMARVLGYSEKQFVQLALQDAMARAGLSYTVTIVAA